MWPYRVVRQVCVAVVAIVPVDGARSSMHTVQPSKLLSRRNTKYLLPHPRSPKRRRPDPDKEKHKLWQLQFFFFVCNSRSMHRRCYAIPSAAAGCWRHFVLSEKRSAWHSEGEGGKRHRTFRHLHSEPSFPKADWCGWDLQLQVAL